MNAEQKAFEEIDGYLYDTETGECMGLATYHGGEQFRICDTETLDWVMGKMLAAETEIAAIETKAAVLHAKTILANAEKMKKPLHSRLEWLHTRFDTEIAEYVRPLLEGRSTRTWKTLYGSVSFRKVPGGLRVKDPAIALAAARLVYPEAIKTTEVFQISLLSDSHRAELERELALDNWTPEDLSRSAFTIQPDEEKTSIKTGLEK